MTQMSTLWQSSVNVPQHYSLIKPALEAKKDIFVEWPLAANLADAIELTNLAKEKSVRTLVGLQARQNPSVLKAKDIVASGKLGKILGTSMYGHGGIFGPTIPEGFLYALPIEAGANLITIPFGHCVDALCYVLGEIESLSATLNNHRPELLLVDSDGTDVKTVKKTAHDYVSISGTLVSGGNVDVQFAGGSSRTGRNFYWEINGTEGSLILDDAPIGHIQMHPLVVKYISNEPGAKPEVVRHARVEKGDSSYNVGKAWDAFVGLGKEEGHQVTTFEDALLRHRMIDAIYRSAEKGTRERYL